MQTRNIEKIRRKKPIQKRTDLTRRNRKQARDQKEDVSSFIGDEQPDLYQDFNMFKEIK